MLPNQRDVGDQWDRHWAALGAPVEGNPANNYRHRLIVARLGAPAPQDTLLDIGCGQGELALRLKRAFPATTVVGLDYSTEGVKRASAAAAAAGMTVEFFQRDLLRHEPVTPARRGRASLAVCSEVLEHVDDPGLLLANATEYLAPGCRLVVTVPAGPRSAFDRHIGHRRHFRPAALRGLLERSGFEVESVERAGFPFFDLYRLTVIARGRRLVRDLEDHAGEPGGSSARAALALFERAFRWNLDASPFGWQLVAVGRLTRPR